MRKLDGFTLIELLIVVVVLAILVSVAIPSYREFVLRSQRSDAVISLAEIANLQEKFFSDNLRYATTLSGNPGDGGIFYPTVSPNGYYDLTMATDALVGYQVTAQPRAGSGQEEDDACQVFTLNGIGQRASSPQNADICWRR